MQHSELILNKKAWEECVRTTHFRACYDLSMAKFALQSSISGR